MNEPLFPVDRQYERRVKWLFAAVILLFPIQYWFSKHLIEPYPALLMPSFAGASLNAAGQVESESADIVAFFDDGTTQTISLRTLMSQAPSSQFQSMAATALKAKPSAPADIWGASPFSQFVHHHIVPGWIVRKLHTY